MYLKYFFIAAAFVFIALSFASCCKKHYAQKNAETEESKTKITTFSDTANPNEADKTASPTPLPAMFQQVVFGSGGGFTGGVTEYTLNPDGTLSEAAKIAPGKEKNFKQLGMVASADMEAVYNEYKSINFKMIEHSQPGNMYYYLQINYPDNTNHRITWGDGDKMCPQNVHHFYMSLMEKRRKVRNLEK